MLSSVRHVTRRRVGASAVRRLSTAPESEVDSLRDLSKLFAQHEKQRDRASMARMLRCVGTNRASRASACAHHCARLVGRPLPANGAGKRLECPTCRKECVVKGGRVTELPLVYGMQGP